MLAQGTARDGAIRARARARARARRRRALFGLLALVIAASLVVGLVNSGGPGPSFLTLRRQLAPGKPAVAVHAPAPSTGGYGSTLAPADQRVTVRFKRAPKSGLLFDVRSGRVLWERAAGRRLPIASLTKMMTALVVARHSAVNAEVLITPQAVHYAGSGVGLLPLGKRVSLLSLLYGLLLPSGNDAAIALAQHVAGSERQFIVMMNAQARAMGLRCSHFATASGIVDFGNYSCTSDLAVLAHAVLEDRLLARIVATRSAILPFPIKGGKLYLYNNNPLLLMRYPGADGVKTGYTEAAGSCLVAAVHRGRTWLGVVLLNSPNPPAQAEKLLSAGFARLRRS